jgi:hypothetical protein
MHKIFWFNVIEAPLMRGLYYGGFYARQFLSAAVSTQAEAGLFSFTSASG